jgi:DNA polymerase I-like protein with 3'-5' exonuclease and polymerase domains
MLEIDKLLRKDELNSVLVNSVHDSVVLDVHPSEVKAVLNIIKYVNKNLKNIIETTYNMDMNVPLLLEAKMGDNWLDVKDVD